MEEATLGITEQSSARALIQRRDYYLDVDSSPPGVTQDTKGWTVRPLKRHVSWVQNVAIQFGSYPLRK